MGLFDPTKAFFIKCAIKGFKNIKPHLTKRFPITLDLLNIIFQKLPLLCSNDYETKLFKAAFITLYCGLFRSGELVANTNADLAHAITVDCIEFLISSRPFGPIFAHAVKIFLPHSKADTEQLGSLICLSRSGYTDLCPVKALTDFLVIRPKIDGLFFCHKDGSPLTRYQLSAILTQCVHGLLPDHLKISLHSFRIGACSTLMSAGFSQKQCMLLGRWKQEATQRIYTRPLNPYNKIYMPPVSDPNLSSKVSDY